MKTFKMIDKWLIEPDYITTESELFKLAYDLYCGEPIGEELEKAKKEFGNDINKVISYIEKECGWKPVAI